MKSMTELMAEYLANGGSVTVARPVLAKGAATSKLSRRAVAEKRRAWVKAAKAAEKAAVAHQ